MPRPSRRQISAMASPRYQPFGLVDTGNDSDDCDDEPSSLQTSRTEASEEDEATAEEILILETQVAQLTDKETLLREKLKDIDALWEKRRQPLLEEIQLVRAEREIKTESLEHLRNHETDGMPPAPGPESFQFVDSAWFACLSNTIIAVNVFLMVFKRLHGAEPCIISWCVPPLLDHVFLVWYCAELGVRYAYHRNDLFCGRVLVVWWYWLDLTIVLSGVIGQWILPLVAQNSETNSNLVALRTLRFLRLFRVLRCLRLLKDVVSNDYAWTETTEFEVFMTSVIAANTLVMWLELDLQSTIWIWVNLVFLLIYILELIARLKHQGWFFFVNRDVLFWNYLDLTIVLTGILDMLLLPAIYLMRGHDATAESGKLGPAVKLLRLLRIARVLRIAKLLHNIRPLYKLLVGVAESMMSIGWVLLLTVLVLYASAIVFTTVDRQGLLPESVDEYFASVLGSMFSLFMVMNGMATFDVFLTESLLGRFLFVTFVIISNWMILAILTAVMSDTMIVESEKHMEDQNKVEREAAHDTRINQLTHLFKEIDNDQDGRLSKEEVAAMLQDPRMCDDLCKAADLEMEEVVDLFESLMKDDESSPTYVAGGKNMKARKLEFRQFIDHLQIDAAPADKRSVVHIMARVRDVEDLVKEMHTVIVKQDSKHASPI